MRAEPEPSRVGAIPAGSRSGSQLRRLFEVLFSPGSAFAGLRAHPTWVLAVAALLATAGLEGWVVAGKLDYERTLRQTYAEQGIELSETDIEHQLQLLSRFGRSTATLVPMMERLMAIASIAVLLSLLVRGLGSRLPVRVGLSVVAHALLPLAVSSSIGVAVALPRAEISAEALDSGLVVSSPTSLVTAAPGSAAFTALRALDLFHFWCAALLVLGYSAASGLPRARLAAAVAGAWGVWLAVRVLWTVVVS